MAQLKPETERTLALTLKYETDKSYEPTNAQPIF